MSALENVTRQIFDQQIEEVLADEPEDFTGWWCIETAPWPCPHEGCGFVAEHVTAAHRIVVWPRQDDPWMLSFAHDAAQLGRAPKIVEYKESEGPCIAYDRWRQLGAPVHGVAVRPEGKEFKKL